MKNKLLKLMATLFACATLAIGFVACDEEQSSQKPNTSDSNSEQTSDIEISDTESESSDEETSDTESESSDEETSNTESESSDEESSDTDSDSDPEPTPHEHNYIEEITAPTCTAQGFTTHSCSCGDSYIDTYVNALDHDFTDYISDNNATHESDGTKTAYCNNAGCNETDTVTDTGTKLQSGISFKTLAVNGTTVYGKVSNATETFSFINEVAVEGIAKFVVSLDIYGVQTIATKTIPLAIGDNTVYITETVDDEPINVYTVTVRRRPMYEVTFNANGGTAVESQTVEEDRYASAPATAKTGYTFASWNYDFNTPITQNTEITASWTANTNTPYKVEYYLQNLENDEYTLQETVNKTGTTDSTANAEIKTFAHFTHTANETDSGNIAPNGSTVLQVYYTRDKYTVTFNGNGGTLISGQESQTVKYGGSVIAPTYEKTGYSFKSYDKTELSNISENFAVTAQWQINQYTITIVYGNGQEDEVITQDYDTTIESIANPNERAGYDFNGWDKEIPATMPAKNSTVTAQWQGIFTVSENTITGLTDYGKECYTELTIPAKIDNVAITIIGDSAFYNYDNLTSITIPDSVTSIGDDAFAYCRNLTRITIPDSVTSIGYRAFAFSDLINVEVPDSVISIGREAFIGCNKLKSISLPFLGMTKDGGVFSHFGDIFGQSRDDGDKYVSALQFVIIRRGKIWSSAFYNCSNLTSIKLPDDITYIYDFTFYNCTNLTSITIPNGVTSIGNSAFEGCSSLTSITIPDGVTCIGGWAFKGCSSLRGVTIGSRVTSIGYMAFYGCSSLTSITIPDSVTRIGNDAFAYCRNLTSITFNGTVEEWSGIVKGGNDWNYNVPATKVVCSDGEVVL